MTIDQQIREVQSKLGLVVDGEAGPKTWAAIHAVIVKPDSVPNGGSTLPVAERSEKVIAKLLPEVRPYARALVNSAAEKGITIHVTSGFRSYEEQDELYAQGRTKPGRIVTNARGGYSAHNFATAFDITVFNGPSPKWEGPEYKTVGQIGKELGLSWGGDWGDEPHFYLRPEWGRSLSEQDLIAGLRERYNTGQPIYTA